MPLEHPGHAVPHNLHQRVDIFWGIPFHADGFVEGQVDGGWIDGWNSATDDASRAYNHGRHNGDAGLDGEHERSLLEGLHLPRARARPLGEDHDDAARRSDQVAGAAQAFYRLLSV